MVNLDGLEGLALRVSGFRESAPGFGQALGDKRRGWLDQ